MNKPLVLALFAILVPLAYADQGSLTNSGGSTLVSSGVTINSTVANPPGSLTIQCPQISAGVCAGGSFSYLSNDGTTTMNASFTSGTFVETCSGGGRGGHVVCSYSFTGYLSGVLTVNGLAQAITGVTYQAFGTGGAAAKGTTAYNSAYTPFYFSNSGQILRSDDLNGTNLISYGTQGGGVGQFYGAYGIALDSAGRIYIADTYNSRVVRIDNMNGANWTSYGTYGSGAGQFKDLQGISIDAAGRIYVMDTGNSRLVRIDDMNGTNWSTMSGIGAGVGQFAQYVAPVAFDASGRIYVADGGNKRLVRMDDMSGTNWTTLTQSPVINGYSYSLQSPIGVAVDAAGKIYIADAEYYQPAVVRVDDMTGTNWTSVYLGASSTPHSIAVDSSGMVLVGGGGAQIVDSMAGVLTSSSALTQYYGPYYVFGATPIPLPSPRPAAINFSPATLSFANQGIGTSSAPQPVTIANFGGSPLNFSSISANGGFSVDSSHCPSSLAGGSNCTVYLSFAPSVIGPANGLLTLADNSGNLGATQVVTLTGLATPPAPVLSAIAPASGNQGQTIATVTLSGSNLSGATINAPSGITVSNVVAKATQVTATFNIDWAATAGSQSVTVTTAGGTSSAVTFVVNAATPPAPTLSSISPSSAPQGANLTVTLTGTNFISSASVTFDGSGVNVVNTTVVSSTRITVAVQIDTNAPLGGGDVFVTTSGGSTGSLTFMVNPPAAAPVLTKISPTSGNQGQTIGTVTVSGANLIGATIKALNGITVSNVGASATQVTATFTIGPGAPAGPQSVTVTTAGGTSNALTFTVNAASGNVSTLASISPNRGKQGSQSNVTLTGTNFDSTSALHFSGTGIGLRNFLVVSSTKITVAFVLSSNTVLGPQNVTITTTAGTSNAVVFTVNPPKPTLTLLSPNSGTHGTAPTVTLTGTNFVAGVSRITVSGSGIAVSNINVTSSTTMTATFTISASGALGNHNVSVSNPGSTSGPQTFTVN